MKINALRTELSRLLIPEDCVRKPVIRRSLREEWIYVTDLPSLIGEKQIEAIRRHLGESGWESEKEAGWMQLRKRIHEPPDGWFEGEFGPEAMCCLSLLSRHPQREAEPDQRIEFALIRAGEEGPGSYEKVCRRLHTLFAGRMRKKQRLPDVSLKYFGGGK